MTQRGFGSAGAGNRSLRRTATRAGIGQTAKIGYLRLGAHPVTREPSAEEVHEGVMAGQCPYCDDTRTFKALPQHWVRAHGIDLQEVRDLLGVPKREPLCSSEMSAEFAARQRRLWPFIKDKFLSAPPGRREFSKYGRQVQRAKLAAIPKAQREENLRRAGAASAAVNTKSRTCVICGNTERYPGAYRTKTCSKACDSVRRRRAVKKANAEGRGARAKRTYGNCVICGTRFWNKGLKQTCSTACEHKVRSRNAKNRSPSHERNLRRSQAAARAKKPVRLCGVPGCKRKHLVHGMCSIHAQRAQAARRKKEATA